MARSEQIYRQWNLLKTLQTRGEGSPLRQLATDFDVSERTIQRDFEILEELGFPIEHEEDEYGKRFWRMPHDFFSTGPLVLGLTEAISLHLAERLLRPLAGTLFAEGLASTLKKIRACVPPKALDYFAQLDNIIHVRRIGLTNYTRHAEIIRLLTEAARAEHSVEIEYHSLWGGKESTRVVDPYGLVIFEGDVYLVGRSHRDKGLRVFKVTRIREAAALTVRFERPAGFSLEEQFEDSFGITQSDGQPVEVAVKFFGPAGGLVEERLWHQSQQHQRLPSEETLFKESPGDPGALVATFTLTNMVELKQWIKGFGDQAEVLKPDWLRQEMREELLAAAKRYEG